MKKTLMLATAAAAFATTGGIANAEEGWYVRGDVGYAFDGVADYDVQDVVIGSIAGDADLGDGLLGLGLGAGYEFGNGFRLEGVVGNRQGELEPDQAFNQNIPWIDNGDNVVAYAPGADGYISFTDVMLNGVLDFKNDSTITPYLGAGLGVARVKAKAYSAVGALVSTGTGTPVVDSTFNANGFNETETGFAWQGLAGVGIQMTDNLTLDLGYNYFTVEGLGMGGNDAVGNNVGH
ncbi:MAG: outer membrane beta-barrel protein, partial [Pseudomonadota bacterium]